MSAPFEKVMLDPGEWTWNILVSTEMYDDFWPVIVTGADPCDFTPYLDGLLQRADREGYDTVTLRYSVDGRISPFGITYASAPAEERRA